MVTFAQNWQDAAAPGLPADHDRFESVDENEAFLNLGGFRRRGARCCVVVSREEEGSRMLPSARCYVDVPVPDSVVILEARDSRRDREPKKVPSIKP